MYDYLILIDDLAPLISISRRRRAAWKRLVARGRLAAWKRLVARGRLARLEVAARGGRAASVGRSW
jgi:hypothetical protein